MATTPQQTERTPKPATAPKSAGKGSQVGAPKREHTAASRSGGIATAHKGSAA